ncbi:molybdopterin dehydrogenase FAD-binding [Solidesulfovibrio carbinoliphilus subsp. oakridgensis]|uniref:Molybdopterin dehydrogenase FAD-binding n=1 Tax=Solidesulfovibrio carbinoliphilus subsp. oakridgensis TaxID=694327 RepID=G7Q4V5_9BACT|nr:xanthine dehydrogenase family protein subunit M [Solidesulfovibrio carbinoliphilus]EHJ47565.1 molybdopterin dehydrogenase FAD-binding [Solidesulfovibrio carbinoliphilus subsp. oakridgensis]
MIRRVFRPESLERLWPLLADGARAMAGGTDLLVRREGQAPMDVALLEGIAELAGIAEEQGLVRLGALASHSSLAAHGLVRERLPVLAQALSTLGSPLVRNMGTLGGNIATASPAGDTLPPLYALDALVELASQDGRRRMPLGDMILGPGRTALSPGEIVAAVLVRPPAADARQHFEKVGRRGALAIAVASLAAVISRDADGRVREARLAVGSVGPTVLRCPAAEAALTGQLLTQDVLQEAAGRIRAAVLPIDDLRATAAYRRQVAGNLLLRLAAREA